MDLEARLVRRYHQLVRSHMVTSDLLSPGVKSSLKSNKAFSQTQAAWRFFNNERCELGELVKPMLTHAVTQSEACQNYALMVHDWSGLIYKADIIRTRVNIYGKINNRFRAHYNLCS